MNITWNVPAGSDTVANTPLSSEVIKMLHGASTPVVNCISSNSVYMTFVIRRELVDRIFISNANWIQNEIPFEHD